MNIRTDDFNKLKAMLVDVYFNLRESGEYLIMEKVDAILLALQNIEAKDIKKRQAFKWFIITIAVELIHRFRENKYKGDKANAQSDYQVKFEKAQNVSNLLWRSALRWYEQISCFFNRRREQRSLFCRLWQNH